MYRLIRDKQAFVALKHVLCSDFPMLPAYTQKGLQRYSMFLDVREKVMNVVDCKNVIYFDYART
jgi:hypothetical protein